jgi:hypothetical protein
LFTTLVGLLYFGYPRAYIKCTHFSTCPITLQVAPFFKQGLGVRVMFIGQDPTIFKQPERVQHGLMLDQERGQLTRWLQQVYRDEIPRDMQAAFTGQFYQAKLKDVTFDYSPCLHIKTLRVTV